MKESKNHFVVNSGEDWADSLCKLGDSYDKTFEGGTKDWENVTCGNCLKGRKKYETEQERAFQGTLIYHNTLNP